MSDAATLNWLATKSNLVARFLSKIEFSDSGWERGLEVGRLTVILHPDWFLDRPRIDRDETDMWIWCLGFLSVGWELAR